MRIGFLGAGRMGLAMAGRLIDRGHELVAWNRTRDKLEPLVDEGGSVAATPREAAQSADVLVSMLADDRAVDAAVLQGEDAAILGLSPGRLHVSMSTISPALSFRLGRAHEGRGQEYVAAPVLGRPEAALKGQVVVLAAGSALALEKAKPIFEAVGRETQRIGEDPKRANVAKLLMNFVLATMIETFGEVYALADRSEIPRERILALLDEAMFKSPMFAAYGRKIAQRAFEPAGFGLRLGQKDVRLLLDTAADADVSMPIADALADRFVEAMDLGMQDADWSAVAVAGRDPTV